jgi:hypothetical protein
MKTINLHRYDLNIFCVSIFIATCFLFSSSIYSAELKVMKMGLGSGTVTSAMPGITCGSDCDHSGTTTVTLTAAPVSPITFIRPDGSTVTETSVFQGWEGGGCSGMSTTCTVTMDTDKSVIAKFGTDDFPAPSSSSPASMPTIPRISDFTPEGIQTYLNTYPQVNTPARFITVLRDDFKQNWILMSRSESLQTGTAESPRILLPSRDAQFVFTVGISEHGSYPGSHHNAIEYMQWDPGTSARPVKNFRFHEIVLDRIAPMIPISGTSGFRIPERDRGVSVDDKKCSKCHSTRNVLNRSTYPATDGVPPRSVTVKNKPNWDAYDSWGGMLPFNRDRIYQGSVEATAIKRIFNLWNWRSSASNDSVRQIIEQLQLQPLHVSMTSPHRIVRNTDNTADDGHIRFGFDFPDPPAITTSTIPTEYPFGGISPGSTTVTRGGRYVTLRHSNPQPLPFNDDYLNPGSDEGRGVQLFDLLGGLDSNLNAQRIADELINHRFATGSVSIDVRPAALAILTPNCITTDMVASSPPPLTINLEFLNTRNGMGINDLVTDTRNRAQSLPRRKADIQKMDLDRPNDPYLFSIAPANGLFQQYGGTAWSGATPQMKMDMLRQEVFRRPIDLGYKDSTVMGEIYVDRELYGTTPPAPGPLTSTDQNTNKVALFRYFLEPLGVSVDKWSMGVRGRSRTYTFADIFLSYENVLISELRSSLISNPVLGLSDPNDCGQLLDAVNSTLSSLPPSDAVPTYTDVQRIFNKSCIECHGGLGYPPYGDGSLDLSEDESPPPTLPAGTPPMMSPRLARSYNNAVLRTTTDPATSPLYQRITNNVTLAHPYNPTGTNENCPGGLMPCGGPPLSKADIETVKRWIVGPPSRPSTAGDPHIKTVDGTNYDFQSAGEFVLLRDEGMEIQARQTAVETESPLGPNAHTGLSSCVSVNSAVAVRIGPHRITYQPDISGKPNPNGLQLRIDGKLTELSSQGIPLKSRMRIAETNVPQAKFVRNLPEGGRIIETSAPGGIQIEAPGSTVVVITPGWWDYYQLWYLNIDVQHPRATEGVMGAIAPGNWLPALPDGSLLGSRPNNDLHQRYSDLYEKFENAWRVSDATTLFDYAPGTSTNTFTIERWPAENPQSCALPKQPGEPPSKPPVKQLKLEVAKQLCSGIVATDRRANCEQDVMVTGETGFADTYLLTEQIDRNKPPSIPKLNLPEDNKENIASTVTFTWDKSSDMDGNPVTYKHCIWSMKEKPTFNSCDSVTSQTVSTGGFNQYILLVILLGGLLLVLLICLGMKKKRNILVLFALAIIITFIIAYIFGQSGTVVSQDTLSKTVSSLKSGNTYYWKVIAEDDKGGSTESETRRFTVN